MITVLKLSSQGFSGIQTTGMCPAQQTWRAGMSETAYCGKHSTFICEQQGSAKQVLMAYRIWRIV